MRRLKKKKKRESSYIVLWYYQRSSGRNVTGRWKYIKNAKHHNVAYLWCHLQHGVELNDLCLVQKPGTVNEFNIFKSKDRFKQENKE